MIVSKLAGISALRVVRAPGGYDLGKFGGSVFLAGTIVQTEVTWREQVIEGLSGMDVVVLDPRRVDWDLSWIQRKTDERFAAQVLWEMDGMEKAGLVLVYFEPGSQSPISLLELGRLVERRARNVVVCCPDGYSHKGYVEMVTAEREVRMVESVDAMVAEARLRLR